ncbi:type IX secretion system motor protein PorM/GldM [Polaribacter glomeratus]|uniref:Gliding motility protein GldM n=1 Tax=Polaribacter glomeratus TaxID=102 RepID=A0A2S7WZ67_9FLAO|nr:gliding motility protein GldM [Polaribacter glomeratus]PQJ82835.1 gliding motility protein GldM [Polaribacter glomeratus]TXD65378.1 gliding motility protein GldM [Polaribacter glomeratus]
MAGGKMSARQKMINLMYLVFIAMLAMNMSKEVLSAFGFMNEKLETNNVSTTEKNNQAYANLATKASEQAAKFDKLNKQALQIKKYSLEFYAYLEELKSQMTADLEDKKAYESMDKTDFLDTYFFKGDNFTQEGQVFLDKVNGYRTNVNKELGAGNKFESVINNRFNTNDVTDKDGDVIPWLKYRYEGFPLIASITNLTQMQADIKNSESDIVSALLGGKLEESLSLTNYKGIVALDKNAYFAGEKVTGRIVLGRYDATMVPDNVILNGQSYKNIESGQVIIDMPAGNVGNHDIKGKITFTQDGKPVDVPFESSYSVIPEPGNAVVSADKMNVVYRGLDNPISVSLPGVSDNNLKVSASGGNLSGSNGKYSIKPGDGGIATINVSATLSSGTTVNSKAIFRIKDIPAAMGSVREQYGIVRMPKSGLANSPISAGLPDFEFDLNITVQGFKIKVPGELTIIVDGSTLSAAAKKVLDKAQRGDIINIYDIKATANGYNLKQVLPVSIELTN